MKNSNKAKTVFNKISNVFGTVILVLSLFFLAFSIYTVSTTANREDAYVFGYKPIYVLSGSMEPTMMTDSVAIMKKANPNDIEVGDIVMFKIQDNNTSKLITHRIIGFNGENVITKGDNNKEEDHFKYNITKSDIKAKVVCRMNWLAPVIKYGNKDNGWIKIIVFIVAAIVAIIVLKISIKSLLKIKKEEKAKDEEANGGDSP